MLLINILDSLTAPCLVNNTAIYTVYGWCGSMAILVHVHTLTRAAGVAGAFFIWTPLTVQSVLLHLFRKRTFQDNCHINRPDVMPVMQLTVSKHCREM